jgi:rhodanese-related sulfurtransferase
MDIPPETNNNTTCTSSSPITFLSTAFSSVNVVTPQPVRRCLARLLDQETEASLRDSHNNARDLSISCPSLLGLQVPQSSCLEFTPRDSTQANNTSNSDTGKHSPYLRCLQNRHQRVSASAKIKMPSLARRPRPILHSKSMEIEKHPRASSNITMTQAEGRKMQPKPQPNSTLPCVHGSHVDLKCISAETLCKLIDGEYNIDYCIVDSRFPFEYEGGHIRGAVNLYEPEQLKKYFLENPQPSISTPKVVVFHCEFSQMRGPSCARELRRQDRILNWELGRYPAVFYPEIYILEGGYKNFFERYKTYCEPCNYVTMFDPEHLNELKQVSKVLKRPKRSLSFAEIATHNSSNNKENIKIDVNVAHTRQTYSNTVNVSHEKCETEQSQIGGKNGCLTPEFKLHFGTAKSHSLPSLPPLDEG